MEQEAGGADDLKALTVEELEALWSRAKQVEMGRETKA
jgi:hypothetical protein